MEYMAGYYRQREESAALLLQHYVCGGVPVCLGCICGGDSREAGIAGGLFTGQLLREFRRFSLWKAVRRPGKSLRKMERAIYRNRENCFASCDFWMAGILCLGEKFLIFSEGSTKTFLCNTGFGRPALCEIGERGRTEEQPLQLQWGCMEPGIGILLASDSFCENIPPEGLLNCLAVKDINDSRQTHKRVQELGCAAERRGGRNMAALLLEVR